MDTKLTCTHQNSLTFVYLTHKAERARTMKIGNLPTVCEVCGEEIVSGESYTCRSCKVWLHKSCANKLLHLPDKISHPLHSQHQLELGLHCDATFVCDKCLYISAGARYYCFDCRFDLDLTCASSVNDPLTEQEWRSFKDRKKKQEIQHYSHSHRLTLFNYRKIKEDEYNCYWCEKHLSDICYGCIQCRFFVHEVCRDKIPRTLKHPFHPSHPLRLNLFHETNKCHGCEELIMNGTLYYGCQICEFSIDFPCAKLLPTLKHKSHHHLLTFFGQNKEAPYQKQRKFKCNVCHMTCDADLYRCVQCDFNLHLQCFPISSSAKHKYHRHQLIFRDSIKEDDSGEYYCDACENERNPKHPVYWCEKCTYIVHIECIVHKDNIMISSEEVPSVDSKALMIGSEGIDDTSRQLLILPLVHEHPMKFYEVTEENQYCNGCRLTLSGPSFICTICPARTEYVPKYQKKYYLHEKCTKLPYEIQHPSHSTHPLYLYPTYLPLSYFFKICDECRDICRGFIYVCEECNFKLDVKCALTAVSQLENQMERVTELNHFTHHHKLILCNSNDPIRETRCSICRLPISGLAYCCPICPHIIHESCIGLPEKMMQVPFHLGHTLVLRNHSYVFGASRCYACGLSFDFVHFRYNCEGSCHIELHSICANSLRRPLKHECHKHKLFYFGTYCQQLFADYITPFCCSKCEKNCGGQPFYRCLRCAINFHLECVPIPHEAKFR
ncbi:hypothetical protein PTKIN_Ptkin01aG0346800 [Pterospermum kingtungense]